MKMNKLFLLLSLSVSIGLQFLWTRFAQAQSQGQMLFVSDIDDTIKRTGVVTGGLTVVTGGLSAIGFFSGMPELYQSFYFNKLAPSGSFIYLSAAPDFLRELSVSFLANSGFPPYSPQLIEGSVITRGNMGDSAGTYKFKKLMEIVSGKVLAGAVLIGDNGEQDIEAYNAFASQMAKQSLRVYSFIHHVYDVSSGGKKVPRNQIEFVSGADLGIRFYNMGWINLPQLEKILRNVAYDSQTSGLTEFVVPDFMSCRDYDFARQWPSLNASGAALIPLAEQAKQNIQNLCR